MYIDKQCAWYAKPLLDSGTIGTRASSQMIIPYKTEIYSDSQDPRVLIASDEAIPACIRGNFPHKIEHCFEWTRLELFDTCIVDPANNAIAYLKDSAAFLDELQKNQTSTG
jgi:ubiquitin-activating enzyme E1